MNDIDDYEIVFPDAMDYGGIEEYETACLRLINAKTDLLIGHVSKAVNPLDFDGPADYCEALCRYVEEHTPFNCSHPYGD